MRLLLVRHASHADADRVLTGRLDGRPLTEVGRAEAAGLARGLARRDVGRVLSSPRARATETADAIAAACGRAVETSDALDEVDFGDWSGRDFAELDALPAWRAWNADRAVAKTPAGDTMVRVQARAAALVRRLAGEGVAGEVVLVTHAEVIRAMVADAIGLALDRWRHLEVSRASVTTLETDGTVAILAGLNWKGD